MRKGKRFSPRLFNKWREDGRGTGTGSEYQPFHQIRRSDPGSRGRSHLLANTWSDRKCHLLSDGEKLAAIFAQQIPDVEDCLEQLPLEEERHLPFLSRFDINTPSVYLPGTVEIAESLNVRHPRAYGDGESGNWRVTTDLAVIRKGPSSKRDVTAISVKDRLPISKRTREKLEIERQYWQAEGHAWIFFVKELVPLAVRLNVIAIAPWTSGSRLESKDVLDRTQALFIDESQLLIVRCLHVIQAEFKVDISTAQKCLWQCIWSGRIPIDLSRDLFRGKPLLRIAYSQFKAFNPIWSGESAWPA